MKISETKKQLHEYIDMIEDEGQIEMLCEAAEAYITKQPDILDLLTPEQLEKLKESQKEIRNGGGISHEEVMKTARQWIQEHTK
jgi:PHD/YefM family antitoxin component YafN of YafNO toxin-antitoxin module